MPREDVGAMNMVRPQGTTKTPRRVTSRVQSEQAMVETGRLARDLGFQVPEIGMRIDPGSGMVTRDPPANAIASAYDYAALRASGQLVDPYEQQAAFQRELGRRFAEPYEAKVALIRMRQMQAAQADPRIDAGSRSAIYPAAAKAGRRMSSMRTFGSAISESVADTARNFLRHEPINTEQYRPETRMKRSGRLSLGQSMTQAVDRDRPWLTLRSTREIEVVNGAPVELGTVEVKVTAGMQGGYTQSRQFHVGGGFTGDMLMGDYDNVTVEVVAVSTTQQDTQLQWAWMSDGMSAGERGLYWYQAIWAGAKTNDYDAQMAVRNPTPEGAYGLYVPADPDAWMWTNPAPGMIQWANMVVSLDASGLLVQNPVVGTMFTPTFNNAAVMNVLWALRLF